MEAKQLLIGDFVKSDLGTIYKVKGVSTRDCGEVLVSTGAADMWYEQSFINPIQLTKEILEKNLKFVTANQYRVVYRLYINERDCIQCTQYATTSERGNELMVYINGLAVSVHVRYVHELQHALRLCGLNNLADNFKI